MADESDKIELTDQQRRLLAERAAATGRPASELIDELLATKAKPRRQPRPGKSLLDAMEKHGLVGVIEGPGDLSTNPDHLRGFGESRAADAPD